jgi:uncharacterized protein YhaN
MDKEKVLEELKKIVSEHMSSEGEKNSKAFEELSELLNKSLADVNKLSDRIVDLEDEKAKLTVSLEESEASVEEKEAELSELKTKLEESEKAMTALEAEKTEVASELDKMKRAEKCRERLDALKADDILFEGEYGEKQKKLAYDASDEDFAVYVEDLKAMKDALAVAATPEPTVAPEPVVEPEGASADNDDDAATPPADIKAGQASAAAVIPNTTSDDSEDVRNKYQEFGKALAERIKKDRSSGEQ